jgi:hypothetical protein
LLVMLVVFAVLCYAAYRILKYSAPQMKTQVHLNKLIAGQKPIQQGGWQPTYDLISALTNEMRLREINQLERVFEYGYRVAASGEWRG